MYICSLKSRALVTFVKIIQLEIVMWQFSDGAILYNIQNQNKIDK